MKLKQILILLAVLAVLVIGVVAKQFYKPPEVATEEFSSLNLSFNVDSVSKIEISKKEKLVELNKGEKYWQLSGGLANKADAKKISEFLNGIREAKGELRGSEKSLWVDFGIQDDAGIKVALLDKQGKSVISLWIGTKKPAYQAVFIRKDGTDQVFLSDADLFRKMGVFGDPATDSPKTDFWQSLGLVELNVDDISSIEGKRIKEGKEIQTIGVLREEDNADPTKKRWKFVRDGLPFGIDAEKVKQFLSTVNGAKAVKVVDPKAKDYGFNTPRWRLTFGRKGKSDVVITAGSVEDSETKGVYLQVSDDELVYLFPTYQFQSLDVDDSKFFISNPLAVVTDKTEKLNIHSDTKDFTLDPKDKKSDAVVAYLGELSKFQVAKLVYDSESQAKVQVNGKYWIEFKSENDTTVTLDVGDVISEQDKNHVVRKRANDVIFAISEATFKTLFENLDRLNPTPAPAAEKPTPAASNVEKAPAAPAAAPVTVPAPAASEKNKDQKKKK